MQSGDALKPFFRAPCSIAEGAQATGIKANTLYRWVQKWCALGLLEVAANRPKRGRPVKLYRATAERFFVPFAATSAPTHEALLREMDSEFYDEFYKSFTRARQDTAPDWGFSFSVGSDDVYYMRPYQNDCEPFAADEPSDVINSWNTDLYLTLEEAKALKRQLRSLWHSPEKRPGTRRYLIQLRLTPAAD